MGALLYHVYAETVGVTGGVCLAIGGVEAYLLETFSSGSSGLYLMLAAIGVFIALVDARRSSCILFSKLVDGLGFFIKGAIYCVVALPCFLNVATFIGGFSVGAAGLMNIRASIKGEKRE